MEKVSNSRIQTYKGCRRMYWFRYVEKIVPIQPAEALERGKSYHAKVEQIMTTGTFEPDDNVKTNAMARAFLEFVFPRIFATDVEEWVEFETKSGHVFHGRLDGRNGQEYLIEHKTTSGEIDEQYITRLQFDEQIKAYMLATGIRKMKYTVCRTPTIRQKQNETEDEYEERCLNWYMEDPERRIRVIDFYAPEDAIQSYAQELDETITEMTQCKLFYRNVRYCTIWGRPCEYMGICAQYKRGEKYIGYAEKEDVDDGSKKAE